VEDDVSSDTKRKRKQRQEDEAANRHQFSVKMPKDDPVLKETIKMVAARLVQDREFHRALDGLVSDPSLREIVDCAASSPGDAALIAKAARTGGLLQMAKIADANEKLANCMARLVGDGAPWRLRAHCSATSARSRPRAARRSRWTLPVSLCETLPSRSSFARCASGEGSELESSVGFWVSSGQAGKLKTVAMGS
jgi:hypothetical protein